MANQIRLTDVKIVANKVDGPEDEQFIRESLPDHEILEFIPFSNALRKVDRPGKSVLSDIDDEIRGKFTRILEGLTD